MVLLSHYKLKASSLTESIIAMVIIAVCLSITMVVYVRVLNTDRNIPSYVAEQKVKELLAEAKLEAAFEDEDYSFESFSISKEVEEMSADQGIYKIQFIVKAGNHKDKYEYIIAN